MLGRKKIVILSLLLVYAIIVPVLAYEYFNQTEPTSVTAGIAVLTPTLQLKFYWDDGCTQPLTPFDFGNIAQPAQPVYMYRHFFIRNEGDVWLALTWNSTLPSITNEIEEKWNYHDHSGPPPSPSEWNSDPINGTRLGPGQVACTCYWICVHPYTAFRTYNWTLTAWGEYYY